MVSFGSVLIRFGTVFEGLVMFGDVWCGLVRFGKVWCGLVRFGKVWYGLVRFGNVWYGLVRFGTVWYRLVAFYYRRTVAMLLISKKEIGPSIFPMLVYINAVCSHTSAEGCPFFQFRWI